MPNLATPEEKIILTFGYGNRKDYEAFLDYLKEFDVTCVIDVRLSPRAWSRKWYRDALEKLCASRNIQYISKVSLGNLSGCNHWVPPENKEAEQALSEVAEILETGNILLLCAEMDSSRCHRVEVASRLQDLTSASVKHLK
ncbi:MAG: DUF488 domain-containing protein [Cyanobacteria bacterium P01_H01_bin.15]